MSSSEEGTGVPVAVGAGTISAPITDPIHEALRERGAVVALRDRATGFEHVLPRARRSTVGGRGGCDVVIDDPCVSGMHCILERRNGSLFVRDHESKNGTYVNGHAVESG